jgi:hypothetical protein
VERCLLNCSFFIMKGTKQICHAGLV